MTGRTVAPFGSWSSPVTPELLTEGTVRLSELWVEGDDVWWLESRPVEAGRQVVVRRSSDGTTADVVPDGFSARTRVHEYGGGSYVVSRDTLVFSNFEDQRLWAVDAGGGRPRPLTPEPPEPAAWRYADARTVPGTDWLMVVRERHHGPRAVDVANDLVGVPLAGGAPKAVVAGRDFYAAPRPSPDGSRLAWLTWDHPNMPWDGTELWVADLATGAGGLEVTGARLVAGGPDESVSQPRWSPDGRLHWVSDRTGWWNLYAAGRRGQNALESPDPLVPRPAEFSGPDWVFGQSTYAFLTAGLRGPNAVDGRLVASWAEGGSDHLGVLGPATGEPGLRGPNAELEELSVPFTQVTALQPYGEGVVVIAASAVAPPAVVVIGLDGSTEVLRASRDAELDPAWIARPEALTFPTTDGATAHALWYPPTNPEYEGPPDERPPLVVMSHGGPTSSTPASLNLAVQFWTTRGIGVVDVDYRGSTGYGREYRRALDGRWGEVDVDDCVAAARYLVERGDVDGRRLAIRGGSAGGFTTLCALTFRDVFAAGASLYGVADLAALASDTHKFESRYLDRLVGPWPEAAGRYRERSPLHAADRLSCPVILLQGTEDKVVPPAQAEVMVEALRAKGLPFAYVSFDGEQHGFRRAETIRRAAELELSFYGQVLGFEPADAIEPVTVEG
jgi:dipeptidyl aminopeptidase/acylaminoacyl peptidase